MISPRLHYWAFYWPLNDTTLGQKFHLQASRIPPFKGSSSATFATKSGACEFLVGSNITETLTQDLERTPSHAKIAKRIGVDQALLDEAIDAASNFHALSIDVEFAASHPENRSALGRVDHDLAAVDNRRQLLALSKGLSSTCLRAVDLYFRMGWTQTEVASDLGATQIRVSRLLSKAISHMRVQARKADSREHRGDGNPARSRSPSSPHPPARTKSLWPHAHRKLLSNPPSLSKPYGSPDTSSVRPSTHQPRISTRHGHPTCARSLPRAGNPSSA